MLKNKCIKLVLALAGTVAVVAVGFLLSLFVIGQSISGDEVHFRANNSGDSMRIIVGTSDSGTALKNPKAKQKGDTIYITAKKVLVSSLCDDGYFDIEINISTAEKVVLGEKVIWTKESEK